VARIVGSKRRIAGSLAGVLLGVMGVAFLLVTHAATVALPIEAEAGTLSGNAKTVATTGASGGSAVQFAGGGTTGQPVALVYDRPPFADTENAQTLGSVLEKSDKHFKVIYVGGTHGQLTAQQLQSAALFAFPGGDVDPDTAKTDFAHEIPLVENFVSNGGHYLGVCAGGFVAGKEGFGVFPGQVGSYIDSPGAQVTDQEDHAIDLLWHDGKSYKVDFQDGNYFDIPQGTPGVTILGTYTNKLPAVAVAPHGLGKAAFSGPHIEETVDDNDPNSLPLWMDNELLNELMK